MPILKLFSFETCKGNLKSRLLHVKAGLIFMRLTVQALCVSNDCFFQTGCWTHGFTIIYIPNNFFDVVKCYAQKVFWFSFHLDNVILQLNFSELSSMFTFRYWTRDLFDFEFWVIWTVVLSIYWVESLPEEMQWKSWLFRHNCSLKYLFGDVYFYVWLFFIYCFLFIIYVVLFLWK